MPRSHAVFLRGSTSASMQPLRAALEGLGLSRARSFGASGTFLSGANEQDDAPLEALIGEALGAEAPRRALGGTLGG